jgi:hypothetical protein
MDMQFYYDVCACPQTLRGEIQKEYRDVVERRVFTGLLCQTLKHTFNCLQFSCINYFIHSCKYPTEQ